VLPGEEGSVDLDHVAVDPGCFGGILCVAERAELGRRLLRLEYLGELSVDGEPLPDPLRREIRPGERPVGVPDLDAQDVRALGEVAYDDRGQAVTDPERGSVDHPRGEHAVRVLSQAELRVVECLASNCVRQKSAEDEASPCKDDRAQEHERPEQTDRRCHPLGH
jgi:hypothetical protein